MKTETLLAGTSATLRETDPHLSFILRITLAG